VSGRQAPVLITEEMVRTMRTGSVIVDLAADQGGNCAMTSPGCNVVKHGVTIIGPLNIASSMAFPASEMYARTVANFFMGLVHEGRIQIDPTDELLRATLITHRGEIVNAQLRSRRTS
jgi:proton-translocating NAD(P)+ transhydrogenase subunit alpha